MEKKNTVIGCPFCGDKDSLEMCDNLHENYGPYYYYILCGNCDCRGPQAGTVDDAITKWNNRIVEF